MKMVEMVGMVSSNLQYCSQSGGIGILKMPISRKQRSIAYLPPSNPLPNPHKIAKKKGYQP